MLQHRNVWVVGVVALGLAAGGSWRVGAQTRAAAQPRVAVSLTVGFILEPGGTLRVWSTDPGARVETTEPAANRMGLGHNNPVKPFTLYPVPGLTDVVAISATLANAYAVLADGRLLAWGGHGSGALGSTALAEFETRNGPKLETPTPVAVPFDAVDVSARDAHVLALARDGSV
jgi:hypothetical protein